MLFQKRKVCLVLTVVFAVCLFAGCDIYANLHPDMDSSVLWVSDDPNMSFSWSEVDGGHQGTLVVGRKTFSIAVGFRSDTMSVLCLGAEDEELIETVLFGGKCKFGINQFTVSVTHDDAGLFGEELPTIVFEKQENKEDTTHGDGSFVLTKSEKSDEKSKK